MVILSKIRPLNKGFYKKRKLDEKSARVHAELAIRRGKKDILLVSKKLLVADNLMRHIREVAKQENGNVFEVMNKLRKSRRFDSLKKGTNLRKKFESAVETVLWLICDDRVKQRIFGYPTNERWLVIKLTVRPWYSMSLKELDRNKSEAIAMNSEGFLKENPWEDWSFW